MMHRAEALTKSVENSGIFKDFEERIDYAVENGLFSVELEHPDIDEEAPSAYALVGYLRERGYDVEWDDCIKVITVRWF